jgi:hypothetical protein
MYGQNVEFVNVKPSGTYRDHWTYSASHFALRSFFLSWSAHMFVIVCSRECGTKIAVNLHWIAVSATVRVHDNYQSPECSISDSTALERAVVPAVLRVCTGVELNHRRMLWRPNRSKLCAASAWWIMGETKGRHVWGKKVRNERRDENAMRNFRLSTAT